MRIQSTFCLLATCQASQFEPLQVVRSSNAEFDELLFGHLDEFDEVDLSDDEGSGTWKDVSSPPKGTRISPPVPIPERDTPVRMPSRHAVGDSYDPVLILSKKRVGSSRLSRIRILFRSWK